MTTKLANYYLFFRHELSFIIIINIHPCASLQMTLTCDYIMTKTQTFQSTTLYNSYIY